MNHKGVFSFRFISELRLKKIHRFIVARHASAGLNLWGHDITSEIKLKIENHWRDNVGQSQYDKNDCTKKKFYVLSMFPYPSGQLHMGHVRVYSISDTVARFYRMEGKNVLHPMGWDSFGLPAENAAIERGIDPSLWTKENIDKMREQLHQLGCSFDWNCEFSTCDPDYYRWTQDLFLKLYEKDLVYRKEALVNWDPIDQTVLADEQVDTKGCSWRSGAKIEKKMLNQWFIKTTSFAKSLYDGLSDRTLKEWRDIIKLQKHWIGECNGISIDFQLISDDSTFPNTLTLWTDKPELIDKAKFVAITSKSFLSQIGNLDNKGDDSQRLNVRVVNPLNDDTLPVFITDNIEYAPFADTHLGIPCASEIDADFCKSVGIDFDLEYIPTSDENNRKREEILEKAKQSNIARYPVSSKLRDWLISRQRYWGTPIPMVHCESCGHQPVPRDELPVVLPKICSISKTGTSPLQQAKDWMETNCPKCNGKATRETDTMDTFVDSSWYFLRYLDSKNDREMFSSHNANKMLPVDLYIGGKEHAVLHLYYARFINHFLHSEGLVPTREPFKQLLVQGMVMGRSYRIKDTGKYLKEDEVAKKGNSFVHKESGDPVVCAWEKMSKSKYNGVDPLEMFAEYGTDTTRLIMLADMAPTSHRNWSSATFPGILKWQRRLWLTVKEFIQKRNELTSEQLATQPSGEEFFKHEELLFDARNYYIKGTTFNIIDSQQLSVAISKMQGLTNSIRRTPADVVARGSEYQRTLAVQIIMLAPFAPHFASELWAGFCSAPRLTYTDPAEEHVINWDKDVLQQNWPKIDKTYKLNLTASVNGHEFLILKLDYQTLKQMNIEDATELIKSQPEFQEYVQNRQIIDVNFHPERGFDAAIEFTTENTEKETLKIEKQQN